MQNHSSDVNIDDLPIAVIGAGVVGLSCALQLQRQGHKVHLYDPERPGSQCSLGNAGHFATEQVFPLACKSLLPKLPKMLFTPTSALRIRPAYFFKLLPWLWRFCMNMRQRPFTRHTQALKALNGQALRAWQCLLADDFDTHIQCNGSLLTFERTPLSRVQALADKYAAHGIAVEVLNKAQVQALEPELNANITYALYFTEVGHTASPQALSDHLFDTLIQAGAKYLALHVEAIQDKGPFCQLVTAGQTRAYRKVVVCTGAYSKVLCQRLGYRLPIEAERGYHYQLQTHHNVTRPIACAERQFIVTPMQQGLRLAGTVEFAGLHTPADYRRAKNLLKHGKELVPCINEEYKQQDCWQGARPSLPDSLPVIGPAPKHPNVYFALGHQHLGLTQAAITSELIAASINEQPTAINLDAFCISRFQ
ncbi:NAD(P)/FAD-dependent oxidoreductase [Pseudoalteromonas sp. T1lg48]|uniref:NAD(P)/FAD-dependent oxidoreductase n=1 Tax=Pseudoalteromonas sp. T1lg48 TaxID=2077100 RepID=UPI000CF73383|nr:FAD-dependent oxidoreductase [Pseudoalteromonas sp. T1lg48]